MPSTTSTQPKMNTDMLAVKADMFDLLVKRFRAAIQANNETAVYSLLREFAVQAAQSRDWLSLEPKHTINGSLAEIPAEHDAHYANT